MQRVLIYPALCLSLAVGAACARDSSDHAAVAPGGDSNGEQVEVTGCLTSNAQTNQFVLTANANALTSMTNRAAAGEAETFHYQLVGGSNLHSYVGQQVTVKGSIADDGKDVDLETKEPAPEPKSRGEEATAAVESSHEIEMQVERVSVASVTPTGSPCQLGQP